MTRASVCVGTEPARASPNGHSLKGRGGRGAGDRIRLGTGAGVRDVQEEPMAMASATRTDARRRMLIVMMTYPRPIMRLRAEGPDGNHRARARVVSGMSARVRL